METPVRDDWYSTYAGSGSPRDAALRQQPVSAPGSPLLPGAYRGGAGGVGGGGAFSFDRFKSQTLGRAESRRAAARAAGAGAAAAAARASMQQPRAGDGIR